jgi:hypothetical protein
LHRAGIVDDEQKVGFRFLRIEGLTTGANYRGRTRKRGAVREIVDGRSGDVRCETAIRAVIAAEACAVGREWRRCDNRAILREWERFKCARLVLLAAEHLAAEKFDSQICDGTELVRWRWSWKTAEEGIVTKQCLDDQTVHFDRVHQTTHGELAAHDVAIRGALYGDCGWQTRASLIVVREEVAARGA